MPMIAAMTAAEIAAAAEAAAAAAAAAEAATVASAASTAAAAAPTAAAAAPTVAAAAPSAGILGAELTAANALGGAGATGATGAGIVAEAAPAIEAATAIGGPGAGAAGTQTAMVNAMNTAGATPGGIAGIPEAAAPLAPAGEVGGMTAQQQAYLNASTAGYGPGITPGVQPLPAYPSVQLSPEALSATGNAPAGQSIYSLTNPGTSSVNAYSANYGMQPANYSLTSGTGTGAGTGLGQGISATSPGAQTYASQLGQAQPSMFDKFSAFADKHPFMTGASLYTGAYKMGLLDQKQAEMPQKKSYGTQYKISDDFQASEPTPNVYTPSYRTYAEGGVMAVGGPSSEVPEPRKVDNPMATISSMADGGGVPGYAKGGTALSDSLEFYKKLTEPQGGKGASAPKADADVGIYYDLDPDTRYQDALTAAQIRQAKLNKRANLQMPTGGVMKRPTPMGQLNLAPPGAKAQDGGGATEAAQGGIMQAGSSLGGYAAGGNPRLLKGPGDGMSDNIPAMIGSKQPARLADGEFVIPADVVSHLGNGSTEAGAKRLHEMMTRVRKERTGNPKQGKQINPRKYMPK